MLRGFHLCLTGDSTNICPSMTLCSGSLLCFMRKPEWPGSSSVFLARHIWYLLLRVMLLSPSVLHPPILSARPRFVYLALKLHRGAGPAAGHKGTKCALSNKIEFSVISAVEGSSLLWFLSSNRGERNAQRKLPGGLKGVQPGLQDVS